MTNPLPDIRITSIKEEIDAADLYTLYRGVGWMEERKGALEKTAAVLDRTDGVVGAITPNGSLVGFVKVLSDGSMYTALAEIVVHPDWQRKGVGRLMMERVRLDWGHTPIFLETFADNRGFFEKCGYLTRENMIVCSKWFDRKQPSRAE